MLTQHRAVHIFLLVFFVATASAISGKFFHISDIHLDILLDTAADPVKSCQSVSDSKHPYGKYGCDSSKDLVKFALSKMAQIDPNPDFILFTGDSLAHNIPQNVTDQTYSSVINYFQKYFPNTTVLPVVGNHDIPENYILGTNAPEFVTLYSYWNQSLAGYATTNSNLKSTYLKGGYYWAELSKHLYLIALNTIYYYPLNSQTNGTGITDPADQFQFLKDTLAMVKQQGGKAIIAQHIPQGANRAGNQLFKTPFENSMASIVQQYADTVSIIFAAHLHRDYFRVYYQSDGRTPAVAVLINGAITPQDDTNPSFTYVSYSPSNILDYDKYYLNINNNNSEWVKEYTFSNTYPGNSAINAQAISQIVTKFSSDNSMLATYKLHTTAEYVPPNRTSTEVNEDCYDACLAQQIQFADFYKCAKDKKCKGVQAPSSVSSTLYYPIYLILVILFVLL